MKAVVYTRISLDRTGESLGVDRQEEACQEEAARLGATVVSVETDNSVSAYTGRRRPGFEAVLDYVRSGRASMILCWHLDRLARRTADLQAVLDLMTGRDAPCPDLVIHPVKGSEIRGDDHSGQLTAGILTLVASFESGHKGERVAAAATAASHERSSARSDVRLRAECTRARRARRLRRPRGLRDFPSHTFSGRRPTPPPPPWTQALQRCLAR